MKVIKSDDIIDRLGRAYYEHDYQGEPLPSEKVPMDYYHQAGETVYCLRAAGLKVVADSD